MKLPRLAKVAPPDNAKPPILLVDSVEPYEGCLDDVRALSLYDDVLTLASSNSRDFRNWDRKRLDNAQTAKDHVFDRSRSLRAARGEEDPDTSYLCDHYTPSMEYAARLSYIAEEWKLRYLFPRTEVVDPALYDQWAEACIRFGHATVEQETYEPAAPLCRALQPLELAPLVGGCAVRILAPPGISVEQLTEAPSNNEVYRWDDVETVREVTVYPSTREFLLEHGVSLD